MKKILIFALLALLFYNCTSKIEHVEKAAYYWKSSNWDFEKEDSLLRNLGLQKLYVKFFEVDRNELMGNIPIAKTDLYSGSYSSNHLDSIIMVPTVYLKNEVFLQSSKSEIDTLVHNVSYLIEKYCTDKFSSSRPITEWQMDCDWTLKSRDNYFYFLKEVKRISKKKLSCTLRLYPYKYPEKMGVPPVDKATLMCYNLLDPLQNKDKNSILDLSELKLYLNKRREYPVHLDVVLPVYFWMLLYQNNRFSHVLQVNSNSVKKILKPIKPLWYEVTKDTVIDGVYLRVGDVIKYEEISPQVLSETIQLLKDKIVFDQNTTVAFFHLDHTLAKKYTHEAFIRLYSDFSQ